jgi:actin-related protein 6
MITQSINKCPESFSKLMYENIIIGGGNTKLPGFKERLENDLQSLKPVDA